LLRGCRCGRRRVKTFVAYDDKPKILYMDSDGAVGELHLPRSGVKVHYVGLEVYGSKKPWSQVRA
jgi:hypothetical protein